MSLPGSRRCSARSSRGSAPSVPPTGWDATKCIIVRFVDTSVLLYAISRDPAEQDKAKRANDLMAERDLALSVQVLQAFYVQATRASRPHPIGRRRTVLPIGSVRRLRVAIITRATP